MIQNYSCNYKLDNSMRISNSLDKDTINSHKEYSKNIPKPTKDPDLMTTPGHDLNVGNNHKFQFRGDNLYDKFSLKNKH